MKYLMLIWLLVASFPLNAESGSYFDPNTGSYYNWAPNIQNGTTVHGSNPGAGSLWTTHIKADGDMHGTDSDMNPWTYNSDTSYYFNYGTGTMCYGAGDLRQCY